MRLKSRSEGSFPDVLERGIPGKPWLFPPRTSPGPATKTRWRPGLTPAPSRQGELRKHSIASLVKRACLYRRRLQRAYRRREDAPQRRLQILFPGKPAPPDPPCDPDSQGNAPSAGLAVLSRARAGDGKRSRGVFRGRPRLRTTNRCSPSTSAFGRIVFHNNSSRHTSAKTRSFRFEFTSITLTLCPAHSRSPSNSAWSASDSQKGCPEALSVEKPCRAKRQRPPARLPGLAVSRWSVQSFPALRLPPTISS